MEEVMNTQDSQSELREKIKSAIKSPMRSQISTADIAVGMMSSTKLSEVIFDIESLIEAYVTTRVKEAERLARIQERQEARNIAHLHRRNECRELDILFDQRLEELTTTTNGKEE